MKHYIASISIFLLAASLTYGQSATAPSSATPASDKDSVVDRIVFNLAGVMPTYKGGREELESFLEKSLTINSDKNEKITFLLTITNKGNVSSHIHTRSGFRQNI
jgi:hypothetical protein